MVAFWSPYPSPEALRTTVVLWIAP